MKNPDLDQLLEKWAARPLPDIPSDFQREVWREIHHREAVQPLSWMDRMEACLDLFLRPTPIVASLILALIMGVAAALPAQSRTSPSLGLYAFSPKAANIQFGKP